MRRLQRSALFPYTTLFRSTAVVGSRMIDEAKIGGITPDMLSMRGRRDDMSGVIPPIFASSDRKSTRLNSSHLGTSYAVFCLKKKRIANGIANDFNDRPSNH